MINEIKVVPLKEVNGIKFGTDRQEIREVFGECKEFKKTPFSSNTADDFGSFHVFYDKDDKFEAIEVFGDIKVILESDVIFPGKIGNLINCVDGFVEESGYYTNYDLSIGTSLIGDELESLCIGCKDYYVN